MTVLLSPTESELAKRLGDGAIVSSIPETHGADIFIPSKYGSYGGQRKECPHDFISSFADGRMARETSLLAKTTTFCDVICEGKFRYSADGSLITSHKVPRKYYRAQIEAMKLDIRLVKGVEIAYTDDIVETTAYIKIVEKFMNKEVHTGLFRRPTGKGLWGTPTTDELWLWILQGFPEVGPGLADKIINHFKIIPLNWTCSYEQLLQVPGIGVGRGKKLWRAMGNEVE